MKEFNFKKLLYKKLIDNSIYVTVKYNEYISENDIIYGHYFKKMMMLLKFNVQHWILKKDMAVLNDTGSVKKNSNFKYIAYPEYEKCCRESNSELLEKCYGYDVISFDIFDTLIFRAVEKPTDIFRLLEIEYNLIDFTSIRKEVERELRSKKLELSIYDIYEKIEEKCMIPKDEGVQKELELEKKVCFANKYMSEIVEKLLKKNKRVIAVSDMYLPKELMRELLDSCGYQGIEEIFVSCDLGKGKSGGGLQKCVMYKIGCDKKYIHIGDNIVSDVKGSQKAGWDAVHYTTVSKVAREYRLMDMDSIASSFYKGIVNTKLHNGMYNEDEYYEYGFVYGGILAQGYCQFLERLAAQENIDQFLFVARDSDIINKACKIRGFLVDYEYIPFSRFASYQITMDRYIEEFIKNAVMTRIGVGKEQSIEQVLREIDLEYLVGEIEKFGLHQDDVLSHKNYEKIKECILKNKEEILKQCEKSKNAAEKYFKEVIGKHKHVCVVDIGWAGTGASCLKYFIEDVIKLPVKVCGALLGTTIKNSVSNAISAGNLFAYLFSTSKNRQLLKKHNPMNNKNYYYSMMLEIMFSADQPSFLKFDFDKDNNIQFIYAQPENNKDIIEKIQKGILDFISIYSYYEKEFGRVLEISGDEAYCPIAFFMENINYCVKLLGDYHINQSLGIFDDDRAKTFEVILRELGVY